MSFCTVASISAALGSPSASNASRIGRSAEIAMMREANASDER